MLSVLLPCRLLSVIPNKAVTGAGVPAATQRDGAKDLVRCKENLEDFADTHITVFNCKRFARDEKLQGMGQL